MCVPVCRAGAAPALPSLPAPPDGVAARRVSAEGGWWAEPAAFDDMAVSAPSPFEVGVAGGARPLRFPGLFLTGPWVDTALLSFHRDRAPLRPLRLAPPAPRKQVGDWPSGAPRAQLYDGAGCPRPPSPGERADIQRDSASAGFVAGDGPNPETYGSSLPPVGGGDGVMLFRLTRNHRSSEVVSLLMDPQGALAHLHKRMIDAGCDIAPDWAGGAKLFVPFTAEQWDDLDAMGLELESHHILALGSDKRAIEEALTPVRRKARPRVSAKHCADPSSPEVAELLFEPRCLRPAGRSLDPLAGRLTCARPTCGPCQDHCEGSLRSYPGGCQCSLYPCFSCRHAAHRCCPIAPVGKSAPDAALQRCGTASVASLAPATPGSERLGPGRAIHPAGHRP